MRTILMFLLMMCICSAQSYEFVEVEKAKPHSISPNIVFVIDASSSINSSDEVSAKFELAWNQIVSYLGFDSLYFCVYVFNDEDSLYRRDWQEVNGLDAENEFKRARDWVRKCTGIFSYGKKALSLAIKEKNKFAKNDYMKRSLTIILITDGGFTEAARYGMSEECKSLGRSPFWPIENAIKESQKWRKRHGLFPATIVSIGLENKEVWSLSVKRSDKECQNFLRKLGKLYHGGYYLVREK